MNNPNKDRETEGLTDKAMAGFNSNVIIQAVAFEVAI